MSFNPYLFFSGNCAEAFERYHEIFGGEVQILRHGELPEGAEPMPGAEPHHVMHAALMVDGDVLLGSDDPTGDGGPKVGLAVSWSGADDAATKATFDQLADGGQVQMPLGPTFWTSSFGVCVDRFGISWMVGTQSES